MKITKFARIIKMQYNRKKNKRKVDIMFDEIIFEKIMKYSENRPQPKGLTNETISKISNYFLKNFNSYLPQGYIEFLTVMNGFSYD